MRKSQEATLLADIRGRLARSDVWPTADDEGEVESLLGP